ncbi:TetR/AcrR family transcriptional regulator [Leucobacter allii]|uniref:TetR/AcrR family transcriptional regulator n=1 Tax=Leucobacter allii TaxID=2932247 RepID=UPI001FD0D48D|nr:TetR/AcrR family transcriptional regulator [Leucobacter allii]UOR02275.1 TetR/AcrR family transcriptional regulator [Leucobacter allii]
MTSEAPDPEPPPRGRQREARDNDRILLRAAREVFAARGWQAPMSAVAEHAGIGIASIYRRYPSKEDLVLRLRILAISELTRVATECLPGEGSAVARFLRRHVGEAPAPLMLGSWREIATAPGIPELAEELRLALEALIARDAAARLVPGDYTPADLMVAIVHLRPGLPTGHERAVELHLRHVDYYLLGLAASIDDPARVSGRGSDWDEWLSFTMRNGAERP